MALRQNNCLDFSLKRCMIGCYNKSNGQCFYMRRERITITIRKDIISKVDTIIDGQKIRNRSNAIETIILEKFENYILGQAVILATRDATKFKNKTTSKSLFPVQGKTLIQKNIEWLKKFGIREVIMATSETEEEIKKILGDGSALGVKITYIKSRGTAGILRKARNLLKGTFLMMNGDILLEGIDIGDMYNFQKKNNAEGTVAVATAADPARLGSIHMKGNFIIDFREKTSDAREQSHLINGGVYILEPKVCNLVTEDGMMIENGVFPVLAKERKLLGYQIGKNWVHLHDEKAYREYLEKK